MFKKEIFPLKPVLQQALPEKLKKKLSSSLNAMSFVIHNNVFCAKDSKSLKDLALYSENTSLESIRQ